MGHPAASDQLSCFRRPAAGGGLKRGSQRGSNQIDRHLDIREHKAMSNDRVPMTREGYEKLKADLDRMQNSEMIEVAKRIAAARDLGDLSENAEYHAAREDQGMLQARVDALKDKLARAYMVDQTTLPKDTVVFGARVRIKNLESGEFEIYELVGPGDEDYDNNKILTTSPRGQGLLGKKVGEIAEIKVPRGILKYQIVDINASA
jgi:transcription elongation factor GreA